MDLLDWTMILFNSDIKITNSKYFSLDQIAGVEPLVVNLTMQNSYVAHLNTTGFDFMENLVLDKVTIGNETSIMLSSSLKVCTSTY